MGDLVSIIITTRNRKEIILECLESVFQMTYPNFEVILVDNASTDGTPEAVREKFPQTKLVVSETNLGLNGGKNLGQTVAQGEHVLFLDSDTIVDPEMLTELVKLAKADLEVGITVPKMYYHSEPDILWYAGATVNFFTSQTKNIGPNEKDRGQYDQTIETSHGPTCFFVKGPAWRAVGEHDQFYFMTYGDTDFAAQAKRAGFKVLYCPKAKLWHRLDRIETVRGLRALGFNLPMRAYYFARNRVIFMKKFAPPLNFFIFILLFFPAFTAWVTYKTIKFGGGWKFLRPHLEGSWDGLRYALGFKVENRWG